MDAIQEILGAILLLLAGVALVLLAIILLLVEANIVLRLLEKVARGARFEEGPDDVAS
jgi:Na+-transporting methylmalonyl-CoA/oxaloacetate decarboxylase gamma subunit